MPLDLSPAEAGRMLSHLESRLQAVEARQADMEKAADERLDSICDVFTLLLKRWYDLQQAQNRASLN